ncbi:DUF3224 domain-containing protein [Bacillus cereus]
MEVTFTVSKWDEKPMMILKKISLLILPMLNMILMGIKRKSFVEYLLYYLDSNINDGHLATAKISGFLHFEGIYKGQQGTFTAIEQGIFDKGNLDSPGTIIKATGNLESLRGSYHYQFTGQTSKLILEFEF